MGSYNIIGTTIAMARVYDGDTRIYIRDWYHDPKAEFAHGVAQRRLVTRAEKLAEYALNHNWPQDEVTKTLKYFGACIDSEKYRLDVKKLEEDLEIQPLFEKYKAERENFKDMIQKGREYIGGEEGMKAIREKYRLSGSKKDWTQVVSFSWHRVIVGQAAKLVRTVVANGGTEEEVKAALKYLIVCIDVNKYLIDYTRYKQENGLVEIGEKYGVKLN